LTNKNNYLIDIYNLSQNKTDWFIWF